MKIKIAAAILAVVALTSVVLVGAAYALPISPILSSRPSQTRWVQATGIVTKWGDLDAKGMLHMQARTALLVNEDTRQFARATVVWTVNLTRPISSFKAKENFTYAFYSARLLNASVSEFTPTEDEYKLTGTWNVATVKSNVTVITNAQDEIVSVHREQNVSVAKKTGELVIMRGPMTFALKLADLDPITGSIIRQVTRQTLFNWYKVTDDVAGTTVTRADVNAVVQRYRAMPGWGNYDNKMDFNFNYKIDIADLATVAANL